MVLASLSATMPLAYLHPLLSCNLVIKKLARSCKIRTKCDKTVFAEHWNLPIATRFCPRIVGSFLPLLIICSPMNFATAIVRNTGCKPIILIPDCVKLLSLPTLAGHNKDRTWSKNHRKTKCPKWRWSQAFYTLYANQIFWLREERTYNMKVNPQLWKVENRCALSTGL